MFLIIGTKFFVWGSERTAESLHCGHCGTVAPFVMKKGMRFITVFFIIPVIPISGVKPLVQCPTFERGAARAEVLVYWIANLIENRFEVYSEPSGPAEEPDYRQYQDHNLSDVVPVIIEGREIGRLTVRNLLP